METNTLAGIIITILTVVITIWLSHRDTMKVLTRINTVLERNHKDAMAIMGRMEAVLTELTSMQKEMHQTLKKVHDGNIANAKIQGYDVVCEVTKEEAEKFGTVVYYGKDTKLAWIKSKPTT